MSDGVRNPQRDIEQGLLTGKSRSTIAMEKSGFLLLGQINLEPENPTKKAETSYVGKEYEKKYNLYQALGYMGEKLQNLGTYMKNSFKKLGTYLGKGYGNNQPSSLAPNPDLIQYKERFCRC